MPCSPEMAPPTSSASSKLACMRAWRSLVVGLEDRDVDVAVADVAAPGDEGPVLLRQLGHLGQVVGDGGPRDARRR